MVSPACSRGALSRHYLSSFFLSPSLIRSPRFDVASFWLPIKLSSSALSAADCIDLMERPILRSVVSTLSTTASSSSPTLANPLAEGSFSWESSETCTSPSIPSSISRKTPKSVTEETFPFTRVPGLYFSGIWLQGSGASCLIPRESRSFSASMLSTTACTFCPLVNSSPGCLTRLVQEMSDTWTRPSIPSSIPINMPKSVIFLICPWILVPIWYLSPITVYGFTSVCLIPREMRRFPLSTPSTTASTSSPTLRISEGCRNRLVQDISETWTSPSTPSSRATKAP